MAGDVGRFRMSPEALWLMGFGLVAAVLACLPRRRRRAQGRAAWLFGAAVSLLGALGVFGLQDGGFLLVAWELMSLGGAVMILSERLAAAPGRAGAVHAGHARGRRRRLLVAFLLLAVPAQSLSFAAFATPAPTLTAAGADRHRTPAVDRLRRQARPAALLRVVSGAYGSGSGATGALLSGVVLNAAFFGLSRGLLDWLPGHGAWRCLRPWHLRGRDRRAERHSGRAVRLPAGRLANLLSFSSAENAAIAVTALGAAMLFRESHDWPISPGSPGPSRCCISRVTRLPRAVCSSPPTASSPRPAAIPIRHSLLAKRTSWIFGVGALFAAMSLAAMPPQAGFVSEWYVFQTVFQGFHLPDLAGRLVLALAGAGLALIAAVAFATFIKVFGIGLLGGGNHVAGRVPGTTVAAVGVLGACVLVLAAGMPAWLPSLIDASLRQFGTDSPARMSDGLLLVPLTAKFSFISPSMLVIAMPLLALVPISLLLANRRFAVRRAPVWYGGVQQDVARTATTALTFSNALRTFYSFIYRPQVETTRESSVRGYFVTRLTFTHDVAPVFGPYLFAPAVRLVRAAADRLRILQSGHLNFYLGLIGLLLVIILGLTLL